MKKSKFGIVVKTLIAFSAALLVLTISLTTATMTPLVEGFEAGGKTAYAAGNVALDTGSWFMDDALTGNPLLIERPALFPLAFGIPVCFT